MICYVLGDCWIVSSGRKCWQTLIASGGLCFKPGTHCFNQISGYFKAAKQLEVHVRPSQAGWKVGKYSRSWKALLLGWQRTWRQHRFDWLETLWTPSTLSLYNLHPARSASAQNLDFCKLVFALFLEILVSMQAGSWRCSRLPKHVQTWSMQPPSHLFMDSFSSQKSLGLAMLLFLCFIWSFCLTQGWVASRAIFLFQNWFHNEKVSRPCKELWGKMLIWPDHSFTMC